MPLSLLSIQRKHIQSALKLLSRSGSIPSRRRSKKYDLEENGKRFPPKYVLVVAYGLANPGKPFHGLKGGEQTNDFLKAHGFRIVPRQGLATPAENRIRKRTMKQKNKFWVVSPNVLNDESVSSWKEAIVAHRAAFMGYGPEERKHKGIGYRFAHQIHENDLILVARSFGNSPELVGLGRVTGPFRTRLENLHAPPFGSLRKLHPFIELRLVPRQLPFERILRHKTALRQLDPNRSKEEKRICEWMQAQIADRGGKRQRPKVEQRNLEARIAKSIENRQLEYQLRTKGEIRRATKAEAALLVRYTTWLKDKGRKLCSLQYGRLQCDAFEEGRNHLIEAKSSVRREYLRMAVGELLDYAFLGRHKFGKPHKAILLPEQPPANCESWLSSLKISVIWEADGKFLDNAGGRFTRKLSTR